MRQSHIDNVCFGSSVTTASVPPGTNARVGQYVQDAALSVLLCDRPAVLLLLLLCEYVSAMRVLAFCTAVRVAKTTGGTEFQQHDGQTVPNLVRRCAV